MEVGVRPRWVKSNFIIHIPLGATATAHQLVPTADALPFFHYQSLLASFLCLLVARRFLIDNGKGRRPAVRNLSLSVGLLGQVPRCLTVGKDEPGPGPTSPPLPAN